MPWLIMSSTIPRISAVMNIIAQTPTVIAPSIMAVRRRLRQRLRQDRVSTAVKRRLIAAMSDRPHGFDRLQQIQPEGRVNGGEQAAYGDNARTQ